MSDISTATSHVFLHRYWLIDPGIFLGLQHELYKQTIIFHCHTYISHKNPVTQRRCDSQRLEKLHAEPIGVAPFPIGPVLNASIRPLIEPPPVISHPPLVPVPVALSTTHQVPVLIAHIPEILLDDDLPAF